MISSEPSELRRATLSANLILVRSRIADACAAASRDPSEVTLVAVTKTYPASDVVHLAALGITDVGENRDQEAAPKAADAAVEGAHPRWHYVGQLQRNKTRSVAGYASVVQSADRLPLIGALSAAREQVMADQVAGALVRVPLEVLIQVSLDGDTARGGADIADVAALAAAITAAPSLSLGGVMAVAPLGMDPLAAFSRLRDVSARLCQTYPSASVISAGMSGDLEAAIVCGATHVRVGSALLGARPPLG